MQLSSLPVLQPLKQFATELVSRGLLLLDDPHFLCSARGAPTVSQLAFGLQKSSQPEAVLLG